MDTKKMLTALIKRHNGLSGLGREVGASRQLVYYWREHGMSVEREVQLRKHYTRVTASRKAKRK
jgi:hypothetical protein